MRTAEAGHRCPLARIGDIGTDRDDRCFGIDMTGKGRSRIPAYDLGFELDIRNR